MTKNICNNIVFETNPVSIFEFMIPDFKLRITFFGKYPTFLIYYEFKS